ncbi:hypothetical protein NDI52_14035 [Leptolyngbya sp. PL-A3]|uniref:hypothetical protein n=1 Tax=Leptolyngbya sp. PL-A3 TaxID=2933911 RepID=UPI003296E93A
MGIEIRTDFDTLEEAIAYLTGDLQTAVSGLEDEKTKLLAKRDELLATVRKTKDKFTKFEKYVDQDLDIDELIEIKDKFESGSSDVKATYEKRYEEDRKRWENRIKALEDERATEKQEAAQEKEKSRVALIKSDGIAELSKPQYQVRNPQQFWTLFFEGQVERNDDGKLVMSGDYKSIADRIKALEMEEDNLHHFKASGVSGSGSSAGVGGVKAKSNPWKKETFNLTEQGRITRENPEEAKRLKAAAGK